MSLPVFIHLHSHSAYSLTEGAIHFSQIVELAKSHAMPAVAMTDTNNLFGVTEFVELATKAGIQPIIGCQVQLRLASNENRLDDYHCRLTLLAQNRVGWINLSKLISHAYLSLDDSMMPQLSLDYIEQFNSGIIALSGGVKGVLDQALLEGKSEVADLTVRRLQAIFGDRFYIELQRLRAVDEAIDSKLDQIETQLLDYAYELTIPIVATNGIYFASPDRFKAHEMLLAIAAKMTISNPDRPRSSPASYFKSPAEMVALFADLPEAIENTVAIARRCSFWPENVKPSFPPYLKANGDENQTLMQQAEQGLRERLKELAISDSSFHRDPETYQKRLDFELSIIVQMGFSGYFLIVADFIAWSRQQGIPVGPGRGSGVGSLTAYCLRITDLDPIRFGLIFERFLNPERASMPDFDVDFCQDRREEVINYVREAYGKDRVAQIITFGKLQSKVAIRDTGRFLEMSYSLCDRVSKLVPVSKDPKNPYDLKDSLQKEPKLKELYDSDSEVKRLVDAAMPIEGLYRQASTHAAGIVIGDRPLDEIVPLFCDAPNAMPATQYNMNAIESTGLVKFDFLGLKTLSVITNAIALIENSEGKKIELQALSLEDLAVYDSLRRGETIGVFQIESSGMTDLARRSQLSNFEDLIAVITLFRPGPMEFIKDYINRKTGREKWQEIDHSFAPILSQTYGCMIYQEQVMALTQLMAGFTLGEADILRRAMGKKNAKDMESVREKFIKGATANGYSEKTSRLVFSHIEKFAGYGFNKSHAAAYALISYQTAWLKYYYPCEFIAATMSYEAGDTDKLNLFRLELQRLGYRLLPPDINRSSAKFSIEYLDQETGVKPDSGNRGRKAVRYGLTAIRNIGTAVIESLCREREERGAFKDIIDFSQRIDSHGLSKRQIEHLAASGAFDSLKDDESLTFAAWRARVYHLADFIINEAALAQMERSSSQKSIFASEPAATMKRSLPTNRKYEDWNEGTLQQREREALGFFMTAHPLDPYLARLNKLGVISSQRLANSDGVVKLAGIVLERNERTSKKGTRYSFLTAADKDGSYEITIFSELLETRRELLDSGKPLVFNVRIQNDSERQPIADDQNQGSQTAQNRKSTQRLVANSIDDLEIACSTLESSTEIEITSERAAVPLQQILVASMVESKAGGSSVRLRFIVPSEDNTASESLPQLVRVKLPGKYKISAELHARLKQVDGVSLVEEVA